MFDNEMLVQALSFGFRVGEISCPSFYFEEASSINFWRFLVPKAVRSVLPRSNRQSQSWTLGLLANKS